MEQSDLERPRETQRDPERTSERIEAWAHAAHPCRRAGDALMHRLL